MCLRELIKALTELPQDAIVILQKDAEGNGYSPCVGAEESRYEPDSTWSGSVLHEEDEDYATRGVPCVVIWPVN